VIPIIFASSLLYLPSLAARSVDNNAVRRSSSATSRRRAPVYILTYFGLTIFFAFFYTAITFNPVDVADNMKKYGGFIPGIRPGRPTAEYLDRVLTRITTPGSIYLGVLAAPAARRRSRPGLPFPFGGAVLLIVVGVGLKTMQQLESQLLQRHYEGFLNS
jgi:preprotein translocase subunit SecY